MIILVRDTSSGRWALQLIKRAPQRRFVQVFLLSPFHSSPDQAHGRQDTFACLWVYVAETLETVVTLRTGGDSSLLPKEWRGMAAGTANDWLLGVLGLFRKYSKTAYILSFGWHKYSSVFNDWRWSSDCVHKWIFFSCL